MTKGKNTKSTKFVTLTVTAEWFGTRIETFPRKIAEHWERIWIAAGHKVTRS